MVMDAAKWMKRVYVYCSEGIYARTYHASLPESKISPEEFIMVPKRKKSKKIIIKGEPKNKSRRRTDIKKRKFLIADSSSENI